VDCGPDGEPPQEGGLGVEEGVQSLQRSAAVGALGEPHKQALVAVLTLGELGIKGLQLTLWKARGQQPQPLAAARLDEGRHQEPVQLPLQRRRPDEGLKPLGVGVPAVAPQRQAPALEPCQHPRQVPGFFSGQPGHLRGKALDVRVGLEQRQGIGCRLLLAVGVVHQHGVQLSNREWKPTRGRLRPKHEASGVGRARRVGGGHGVHVEGDFFSLS
jgi:hypothetical protein